MSDIKSDIRHYMLEISLIMVFSLLTASIVINVLFIQHQANLSAESMFEQIGHIIAENRNNLNENKKDYTNSCINNAECIAYMIQYNPSVLNDLADLKGLADMVGVDEIHIFDDTGTIVKGTNPEYYGYTFSSGEQIGFFSPMLSDKSLQLSQDIAPNTAEGKLMQYTAVWMQNGKYIVQIGMKPTTVIRSTQKNNLSYIFKLLHNRDGIDLYAMEKKSGLIIGSTNTEIIGKKMYDIGFVGLTPNQRIASLPINGKNSYCVLKEIDNTLIGYVISNGVLYHDIFTNMAMLLIGLMLIAVILVISVTRYMNRTIVQSIHNINDALAEISAGNLEKNIDMRINTEFCELSDHINSMIHSLLASTDKISFALSKTNMPIGVYEYNKNMKNVRYTEYVPKILALTPKEAEWIFSDYRILREHISELCCDPLPGEESIYRIPGKNEQYLKFDEVFDGNGGVMGIILDMTQEIRMRRRIESERDIDVLTGLYNRRGINAALTKLFENPASLMHGMMIFIDSDDLKTVNDNYGHDNGDAYIRRTSEIISTFGKYNNLSARLGGDEFAMLLYGYPSEKEVDEDIKAFHEMKDKYSLTLENGVSVPIRFSAGCVKIFGETDYHILMRRADESMYEDKRSRK